MLRMYMILCLLLAPLTVKAGVIQYEFQANLVNDFSNQNATNVFGFMEVEEGTYLSLMSTGDWDVIGKIDIEIFGTLPTETRRGQIRPFHAWPIHPTTGNLSAYGAMGMITFALDGKDFNYSDFASNLDLTKWDSISITVSGQDDVSGNTYPTSLHGTFEITELNKVPEPETLLMFMMGCLLLARHRRS